MTISVEMGLIWLDTRLKSQNIKTLNKILISIIKRTNASLILHQFIMFPFLALKEKTKKETVTGILTF